MKTYRINIEFARGLDTIKFHILAYSKDEALSRMQSMLNPFIMDDVRIMEVVCE